MQGEGFRLPPIWQDLAIYPRGGYVQESFDILPGYVSVLVTRYTSGAYLAKESGKSGWSVQRGIVARHSGIVARQTAEVMGSNTVMCQKVVGRVQRGLSRDKGMIVARQCDMSPNKWKNSSRHISHSNPKLPPWLSSSADFAFGFQFLPQNGLFLLSIWYYNLPEKTIVWYANDGNLVPSGSTLELNAQDGLVLTDPQGNQLCSTPILSTIDHGFINNTGNFVLLGSDSSISWQSFENPTDTLLPAQTMEINGVLNSRISDTNFSQGKFQFRLLEDGNAVLNRRDVLSNYAYEAYFWSNTYDG
ncbi:hypothetical protein LguiA_021724 [Lonicera macranthoides]